jgi:[ribosomal protein S5]-alanine N-acetyltransferase
MPPGYPRRPVRTPLPLLTEHLELREPRMSDAPALFHDVYGDPEVMRWVAGGPLADLASTREALATFRAHQRAHGFTWWTVVERATGRVVGDAGLFSYAGTGPEVEVGYTFARDAWGKGYATEAAVASLEAAFGPLALARVLAVVRPENGASQRVLEKAGMRRDGRTDYRGAEYVRYLVERDAWRRS